MRKQWLEFKKNNEKKNNETVRLLHFSLACFSHREAATGFAHKVYKKRGFKPRCKSVTKKEKGNVQLDVVALSLHIAAGECALKNYLVVQVEEKRSPSVGEELAVKTDT